MKLSPQQEVILSHLRGHQWVCGSKWLNGIKDDRARISAMNNDGTNNKPKGYMFLKGYKIIGEPCKGRFCARAKCPLDARKAVPLKQAEIGITAQPIPKRQEILGYAAELCRKFDAGEPVFRVV